MTSLNMSEPVGSSLSLDMAKRFLRIDYDSDDELIANLIEMAVERTERECELALIQRSGILVQEGNPPPPISTGKLTIPIRPILQIVSVKGDGSQTGNASFGDAFTLIDPLTSPALLFRPNKNTGSVADVTRLEISLIAGFGSHTSNIPAQLLYVMQLIILKAWRDRLDDAGEDLGPAIEAAMQPWRRARL